MRYGIKKWILCLTAVMLLGNMTVWAAPQPPMGGLHGEGLGEGGAGNEEGAGEDGTGNGEEAGQPGAGNGEEPVQPGARNGKVRGNDETEEPGALEPVRPEGVPTGQVNRFTKDHLVMLAAGFGAGAVLAGIISLFCHKVWKKKENKKKRSRNKSKEGGMKEDFYQTERADALVVPPVAESRISQISGRASMPDAQKGMVGTVHHIGCRKSQQDTFSVNQTPDGLLALVSDGMGGLEDSDKVSQRAVMGMLQAGSKGSGSSGENPLFEMLGVANEQVLEMLGPDQIYKSGATLLAVMAYDSGFHWIAVGDSRIYLYCSGHLFQINREHIYKQELVKEAVNRNISFSRISTDPQRERLISFLGMGELKYIDGSLRPVEVRQGDKVLLMSDGIFNTISEKEIIRILENTANAKAAAALMEQQVLHAGNLKQDNFTCVILDF